MLGAGANGTTRGESCGAGDAAVTKVCGSAREDAGILCCETAACPRLPRVDTPLLGCARLGGGGESSLSSLGIGLVRRLLRSLLPIVSMMLMLILSLTFGEEGGGESAFERYPKKVPTRQRRDMSQYQMMKMNDNDHTEHVLFDTSQAQPVSA